MKESKEFLMETDPVMKGAPTLQQRSAATPDYNTLSTTGRGTMPLYPEPIQSWQWVAMTSFSLVYSMVNTSMGLVVLPMEAERLNTTGAGLWVGVYLAVCGATQLICPLAGKVSDCHASPLGRRRPFIALGSFAAAVGFLVLRAASRNLWPQAYIFGLFATQLALNVVYSAQCSLPADMQEFNGHDLEKSHNGATKGVVSGFVAMHSFLGSLVAVGTIVATQDMPTSTEYSIYCVSLFLACFVVCLSVHEMPTDYPHKIREELTVHQLMKSYTLDLRDDRDFLWVCIGRLCFYISTSVVAFLYYYIRDMIRIADETELKFRLALLIVCAQLVGAAVTIPASQMSNRMGRKPVIYCACATMCCTFGLYVVAPTVAGGSWPVVLVAGLIYGVGSGAYLSVDYALALDCLPAGKTAAEAFGLWGVAGFAGSSLGPVVAGLLLTSCRGTVDTTAAYSFPGYALVMLVLGCCSNGLVVLATSRIRRSP